MEHMTTNVPARPSSPLDALRREWRRYAKANPYTALPFMYWLDLHHPIGSETGGAL